MNRSVTGVSLALVAVLSLGACSQQPADNGPDYADDEAMELIADGLENRSDVIDQQIENGESTGTNKAYEEVLVRELLTEEDFIIRDVVEVKSVEEAVKKEVETPTVEVATDDLFASLLF